MLFKDHKPQFGNWAGEIDSADLREYRRGDWSDLLLPMREKRWQFIGLYSDEFIIGLAVVHAGYIGNIFAYVFNRKSGAFWELERTAPLAQGIRFERSIYQSTVAYRTVDEHIRFNNNLADGKRGIDVKLKNEGLILDIRAEIIDDIENHKPLQTLMPTPDGDCSFTHKTAGLSAVGKIRLGDQHWNLEDTKTFAVVDTTVGYHARETQWNWASFSGMSSGTSVGLNLANPTHSENAFWIAGVQHRVGPVEFQYTDGESPWRIKSQQDDTLAIVDLTFTPLHCRRQNINFIVLSSSFEQPCGVFNGTLQTSTGETIAIENVPGVVEEHFARW
jgi:hypothetical protein